MTPAVKAAQAAGVVFKIHEYAHDPANTNYGHEAAEVLGLDPSRVFKTLLVALNGDAKRLAVAVVPVDGQLNLKAMASACGVKRLRAGRGQPAGAEETPADDRRRKREAF